MWIWVTRWIPEPESVFGFRSWLWVTLWALLNISLLWSPSLYKEGTDMYFLGFTRGVNESHVETCLLFLVISLPSCTFSFMCVSSGCNLWRL